jgi:hypothetical protein
VHVSKVPARKTGRIGKIRQTELSATYLEIRVLLELNNSAPAKEARNESSTDGFLSFIFARLFAGFEAADFVIKDLLFFLKSPHLWNLAR